MLLGGKVLMNKVYCLLLLSSIIIMNGISSQNPFEEVEVEISKLSPNLYRLYLTNVTVVALIGSEGILLSDAARYRTGPSLKKALEKICREPIKIIINTHWHHDHTGGNNFFGKEATIIAHHTVREHLSEEQYQSLWQEKYEAYPEYARPHITYSDRMHLYVNDEEVEIIHLPNGHSAGDAVVYFKKANVLHLGDLLFADKFPAIDYDHGGNVKQFVKNLDEIIKSMPSDVTIVPGHGRNYTMNDLEAYRNMISSTAAIVEEAMKNGQSLDEMKKANILKDWAKWEQNYFTCNEWIEIIYNSL